MLADYAKSCGEIAPKYTDPNDSDFQPPPSPPAFSPSNVIQTGSRPSKVWAWTLASQSLRRAPCVRAYPFLPALMHDIYTKSGRSGRMVFFVNRMEFTDPDGTFLGSADTSIVIREKPQE